MKSNFLRRFVLLTIDIVFVFLAYVGSYYFRFSNGIPRDYTRTYFSYILLAATIYIVVFVIFKLYRSLWVYASVDEFMYVVAAVAVASTIVLIVSSYKLKELPVSINLMAAILILLGSLTARMSLRVIRRLLRYFDKKTIALEPKRVMIVGAGNAGQIVIRELVSSLSVHAKAVCFIDDNTSKLGSMISNVPILGTRDNILDIVEDKMIDIIIVAIPTINVSERKELLDICNQTNCEVKIMPGVYEIINGQKTVSKLRDVQIEDLLGRDSIKLEEEGINDYLHNKVVMITGGGGSIGSELARQIVKFKPKTLIILDIYENNAYDLQMELLRNYPDIDLKVLIASVRDVTRLDHIFAKENIDVIFHAAAHKHVPLMEENPTEVVKNNIYGTYNMAQMANKYHIKRFVMISTDKAVNPTNVMGASKRACEMIIQATNAISKTEFVAVRFGNVLGSNGSVIPLFKNQIASGGPVTVTHKDIIRYFMTIPEASQLVLQAGAYAKGGEIFILDMGEPVRIYDLACNLIKLSGYKVNDDIKVEITGLRPGEKLYEELLMAEEGLSKTRNDKIFVGKPAYHNLDELKEHFNEFDELISSGRQDEIRIAIKNMVPTYKEP